MEVRYQLGKLAGLLGRLHPLRWRILDIRSGAAIRFRSAGLAETVLELLNEADAGRLPPRKLTESPFKHYQYLEDTLGGAVNQVEPGYIRPIARTDDAELGKQVAELFNRIDPAKKIRVKRIGWW
jgi:hypothetical protein